nr:hypothetical protein [uncultured Sphingomonas sp.]
MTPSFDNSYARLRERFFAKAKPAPFSAPTLTASATTSASSSSIKVRALNSRWLLAATVKGSLVGMELNVEPAGQAREGSVLIRIEKT